jgi:hypothetical protein
VLTQNEPGLPLVKAGLPRDNNNARFFAETGPNRSTFMAGTSFPATLPRQGALHCGNPAISPFVSGLNEYFNTLSPDNYSVQLNGVPPGRYVVTLAATDRNGDGLSFEWDLPIDIPYNSGDQDIAVYQQGGCRY